MAVSTNFSLLFLLFFLLFSLKIQARAVRESHFSNEAVGDNNANEPETVDKKLPSPQQEEPPLQTQQSQNRYGLYGNAYNQYSPTTSTNNLNHAKYSSEYTQGRSYDDNKDSTDTTVYPIPNTQYVDTKYGMSDTRFLENGRYFYDLSTEHNRNGYESTRGNNMVYYGPSRRVDPINRYNNGGGYYGDNENAYKYENSMDRFPNSQETEEDFEP